MCIQTLVFKPATQGKHLDLSKIYLIPYFFGSTSTIFLCMCKQKKSYSNNVYDNRKQGKIILKAD